MQLNWWSRGVFQWRISQIMQRNHCVNALTSKLWFGGRSYVTFWPLPTINGTFSNRNSISNEISIIMSKKRAMLLLAPRSGLLNCKLGEVFSLVCTLGNSNIAITILHCNFESALVWKQSEFPSWITVNCCMLTGADPGFSFRGAQKIMCPHAHYERGTKLTFGKL